MLGLLILSMFLLRLFVVFYTMVVFYCLFCVRHEFWFYLQLSLEIDIYIYIFFKFIYYLFINFLSLLILLYIPCVPLKVVLKLRILCAGLIYSEGKTKLYYMRSTRVTGTGQGWQAIRYYWFRVALKMQVQRLNKSVSHLLPSITRLVFYVRWPISLLGVPILWDRCLKM